MHGYSDDRGNKFDYFDLEVSVVTADRRCRAFTLASCGIWYTINEDANGVLDVKSNHAHGNATLEYENLSAYSYPFFTRFFVFVKFH